MIAEMTKNYFVCVFLIFQSQKVGSQQMRASLTSAITTPSTYDSALMVEYRQVSNIRRTLISH